MTPLALLASSLPLAAAVASSSRHRELARKLHTRQAPAGQFEVVGDSGVSAQMMFLGTENTVFILDSALSLTSCLRSSLVQKPRTTR